jgi:putative two-component system response regulator
MKELKVRPAQGDSRETTLLVVEDDPAMLVALRDILEGAGYMVHTAANGEVALKLMMEIDPSLILSDISMPIMDGIELFERVREQPEGAAIPFIFLTARGTREDIFAGKSLGADDYITKPVTSQELLSAVQARLQRTDELMVAQLKTAYKASLMVLANAIEARDYYTRNHVERVSAYADAMALNLGWREQKRTVLEFGAILHDIGKISIRESILRKTGPLGKEEWGEMRQHPIVGARMLEGIPYLTPSIPIVLYHHERWDGSGYPEGLETDEIPEEARLLAVADTFDAMTSDRPYRKALPVSLAYETITSETDQLFDPAMVEAFVQCWNSGQIKSIRQSTDV